MERQFTRQAENALKLAKTTARSCGHSYIGTEHLLAGLLKEPEGTAGKVLEEFHVEEEKLMELISQLIAPAQGEVAVKEPKEPEYSPRSRRILEQAQEDAQSMDSICRNRAYPSCTSERDRLCRNQTFIYHGRKYSETVLLQILTAMGFDNDTIAEEIPVCQEVPETRRQQ